jgi:hypothetical protein
MRTERKLSTKQPAGRKPAKKPAQSRPRDRDAVLQDFGPLRGRDRTGYPRLRRPGSRSAGRDFDVAGAHAGQRP